MATIRDITPNGNLLGLNGSLADTLRVTKSDIAKSFAKPDAMCNDMMSSIMAKHKPFSKEDDEVSCRPAGQQWPVCTP